MRFSSDEEIFEDNSKQPQNDQSQDPKQTPVKKEKKQTMLSKFLDSLDSSAIKKLQDYEKLKRPVFERRAIVPPKISLYEDVLFVLAFKEHREKLSQEGKEIKDVCADLESRTKRKQCTIKQRIQKKLCKMSAGELLDHVLKDKDISFNLKKELTSGAKIEHQKSQIKKVSEISQQKQKPSQITLSEQSKSKIDLKQNDATSINANNTPSKKSEQILEEKQDKKMLLQETPQQKGQKSEGQISQEVQQYDDGQIFIIFKKDTECENLFMINRMILQKEINELKRKEEETKQREELMKQLKAQMEIIMHFRNKFSTIPHEVQMLIDEAHKIMKLLGISEVEMEQNNLQTQQNTVQEEKIIEEKIIEEKNTENKKTIEATADRAEQPQASKEEMMTQNQVTEFNIEQEKSEKQEKPEPQTQAPIYSISYALCENPEYIKLYQSNPQVFEPLLWSYEEDSLIDKLIEDFPSHERLFSLVIRYKGPETFIDRCVFMKKPIKEGKLVEAIKNCKPLNLSKLNAYLAQVKEEMRLQEGENLLDEVMGDERRMEIEC